MKFQITLITLALASMSISSQAAYNIYQKNGLKIDFGGELSANFSKKSDKDIYYKITNRDYTAYLKRQKFEDHQDRRTRLSYDNNNSYLYLYAHQQLDQNWQASAHLGISYDPTNYLYLSNANVELQRKHIGSIALGKQYLHTGVITQTNTYYPVDSYSNNALRVDYTQLRNLHLSAYYMFPESVDVRKQDSYNKISGTGVSGTYLAEFAPEHYLKFGAAFTQHQFNPLIEYDYTHPETDYIQQRGTAKREYASLFSIKYRLNKLILATDIARTIEKYRNDVIDEGHSNYLGFLAKYQFTPKFNLAFGYGLAKIKRSLVIDEIIYHKNRTQIPEMKKNLYYIKTEYDLRDNITVYAKYLREKTRYNRDDIGLLSSHKRSEISGGISIAF